MPLIADEEDLELILGNLLLIEDARLKRLAIFMKNINTLK